MQKQDFIKEFQKLLQAFTVNDPKEKSEIYFHYLNTMDLKTFSKACDKAIMTSDRLPTIARLQEIANAIPKNDTTVFVSCDNCKGDGRISHQNTYGQWFTTRCSCENGNRFQNLPM